MFHMEQVISVSGLLKKQKHRKRLAKQKAKKRATIAAAKEQKSKDNGVGQLYYARVLTGLVPYNHGGTTEYLIKAGIKVIAEKMKRDFFRIYLVNGNVKTYSELKEKARGSMSKGYKVYPEARRFELKLMGEAVIIERS